MHALRFNYSYRRVIAIGRSSGLPLPAEDTTSFLEAKSATAYQILIAIFVMAKIVCATYALTHNDKFEEVTFCAATLMFTITGTLLTLFYTVWRREYVLLTDKTDALCSLILDSDLDMKEFFHELYTSDARRLSMFATFMAISTVTSPVFFCLSVPVTGLIVGNYGEKMALPTHCDFELAHRSLYEVFVLLELLGLIYPAIQKLANEFIMLGLLKTQAAFFKYLAAAMQHMAREASNAGDSIDRRKLMVWIKIHQAVIRNAHDLVAFFSPVVVLYYLSIICIVAGGVFYQLNASDANVVSTWFLGMYMVITVIHLYVQCHMAEELTSEAENLAQEMYSIPWHIMDSKSKGYIKLIINMANRPIKVVAFKAVSFTLNKESFVAFITNMISAYMGFHKIMHMED